MTKSPLVGRNDQLETLSDVVARAIDFQAPQLVTVVGNQGTGKTRLIQELEPLLAQHHSGDRACRVYHGHAERDAEGKAVRHAALASLLRHRFELLPVPDETSRLRFAHEVRTVMSSDHVAEMLHFVGGFIGIDYPPTPFLKAVAENPKQHAEIARTALRRFLELDAAQSPLVLVLDDMQWADSDTLGLVSEIVSGLGGSPVVVLTAARPDMLVHAAGWGEGAVDHERIDLRNLEPDDAEQMFRNLLSRVRDIPEETAQSAVEMTGGNPAFLEQLVRLFFENGTIDVRGPVWRLDPDRAADTDLPVSIEEAIEARIAALENDERDLLEKAAVFGNVFWVSAVIAMTRLEAPPALAAITPYPAPLDLEWGEGEDVRRRISDLIASLAERDYVLPLEVDDSSIPGEAEVVFKHNLDARADHPVDRERPPRPLLPVGRAVARGQDGPAQRRAARVPRGALRARRRAAARGALLPAGRRSGARPLRTRRGARAVREGPGDARRGRRAGAARRAPQPRRRARAERAGRGGDAVLPRDAAAGVALRQPRQGRRRVQPARARPAPARQVRRPRWITCGGPTRCSSSRATSAASRRRSTTWAGSTGCAARSATRSTSIARR